MNCKVITGRQHNIINSIYTEIDNKGNVVIYKLDRDNCMIKVIVKRS